MAWEGTLQEHRTAVVAAALVVPPACCAALAALRSDVPNATSALVLVLVIVAVAATGDRVPGFVAAVSSGVWFDFFLTEPYQRFTIADSDDVEAVVLLVAIGLAVTEIALWGRRQQDRAARRSGYLEGVLGTAQVVSQGDTPAPALVEVVARQITDVLGADGCRFVKGPVYDARIAMLDHDGVVTRRDRAVDVDRQGLPSDEYLAIPVRRGSRIVGHFEVTATTRVAYPSREQRRVAVLLADQVAAAVDAG